jgi:hypothetical protein
MANGKKSFVAYADWKDVFDELPNEEAGKLIKHIFSYVNDESPKSESLLINAVFANIKSTLKRDLDKWENTKGSRSKAGKASAEARKKDKENKQNPTNLTNVEFVEQNSTNSTVSVNVNDNVNTTTVIKYSAEKAIEICLIDLEWVSEVEKNYNLKNEHFILAFNDFKSHCISIGKNEERTIFDFKYHFVNWVKKKKEAKVKETTKDKL